MNRKMVIEEHKNIIINLLDEVKIKTYLENFAASL
ncbi:hypothetical protein PRO82_002248 [Candidatus Protochlamydia amoebophila]|nr:hypothetical protein [Candidatus Protochlamydia amoebophila]